MKSKYTPFLPVSTGRQSTLSFGKTGGGGDIATNGDDDDDEEEGEEEDSTLGSQ